MRKAIFLFILVFLLLLSGYIYWFFFNVYSTGYREGVLFKFSTKGNIFKTNEGEMLQPGFRSNVPGTFNTNNFYFSVVDDSLKKVLDNANGKTVKVHYVQYRKSLPWRGENYNAKNQEIGQYIVDRADVIAETPANRSGITN